ncbi:anne boleyn [Carabus blaptoides fortunei]
MGIQGKEYVRFSCFGKRNEEINTPEQQTGLLKDVSDSTTRPFYINYGQDDQMQIYGYKRNKLKTVVTWFFIILSGGVLRLFFHWIPHWLLFVTSSRCAFDLAETILIIESYKNKHKIYHVKPLQILTPDTVKKLENDQNKCLSNVNNDFKDIPINLSVHFENGVFKIVDRLLYFKCKKLIYVYDTEKNEFVKLRGLDVGVKSEIFHKSQGLSSSEQFMRRLVYGPNEIVVPEKTVLTLLFLEVLNPFYIFQLFSFCLWFADNYYYYAMAILIMSAGGIIMAVIQTRKNQHNLKSTVHSSDVATVIRGNNKILQDPTFCEGIQTEVISTELLVPGDILEIPTHGCIMHCDAVLLAGNCIVNESMLTGESVPVTKTPIPNVPNLMYDPKEHSRHTLFCGTQVIQTRYFGNEKVLAIVIRTGFTTAKGGLVRSILYPPPVDFRFEKDSYRFVVLLAGIASIGFIYTVFTKFHRGVAVRDLVLEAMDLITIVVPPALPAAMTVGRLYAQKRLEKNNIYCISPRTINVSGSIDCVCFDKTGTLTEDGLDMLCVVPIREKYFDIPVKNIENMAMNTFFCGMVSCHSLTLIDKQITGDPLDLKMFESTKWIIEEHETSDSTKFNMIFPTVVKPATSKCSPTAEDSELNDDIGIIREFPFSSSSQRMGVIIRKLCGQHFEYYCKGSPEMILNFVKPESVPEDFLNVLKAYTQQGYRVIAMAHKVLNKMSYAKVLRVQRDVIECDMNLLGLIVLENRLKPDTTPSISMLNNANIRTIMVTGDNILTAVSVAKECGIIVQSQSVITVNVDGDSPPQVYYTLTNTKNKQLAASNSCDNSITDSASVASLETVESAMVSATQNADYAEKPQNLFNNYRFGLTGKVWSAIRIYYPDLIPKLVTRGAIFARMSPDQKQQLVEELQGLGYYVAMCGDGANDCGALKAAHTGISLSEAESSVASPFTSKNSNIACVPNIIKEGRAALVTSFDLFIISIFAFFFGKTEAYSGKLVKETPLSSLISLSPILSLFLQLLLVSAFQVAALKHVQAEEWFVPFNASHREDSENVACFENYTIFALSSFQYVILAIVFSKGKPYRQSIFSNYGLVVSAIGLTIFNAYLVLYPFDFLKNNFELILPPVWEFKLYILGYAIAHFVIATIIEVCIIEHLVFKKLRFKYHNIDKSRRKFLAIERDLQKDSSWPTLSLDYKSSASPQSLTQTPKYIAEIVIENENVFDKNHVLNSFFDVTRSNDLSKDNDSSHVDNYESELKLDPANLSVTGDTCINKTNNHATLSCDELACNRVLGRNIKCLSESAPNVSSVNCFVQIPIERVDNQNLDNSAIMEMNNIELR